jgi:hypothetical protein
MSIEMTSECGLMGVTAKSFVPGLMDEFIHMDEASFLGAPGGAVYSVVADVSRVPAGQVASIGFSSLGVVDSCTSTTLDLVDPLVFRVKERENEGA